MEREPAGWHCGCGWANGLNLSVCGMCGRNPSEGQGVTFYRTQRPVTLQMVADETERLGLDIPLVVEVRRQGAADSEPALYIESLLPRTRILRVIGKLIAKYDELQRSTPDTFDREFYKSRSVALSEALAALLEEMGG